MRVLALWLGLLSTLAWAGGEPLSLDEALALAEQGYPQSQAVRQRWLQARAEQRLSDSSTGLVLGLDGQLRWVRPPPRFDDRIRDDHRVRLYMRKRLYDFGRSQGERQAARAEAEAWQWLWLDARQRHRLAVMEAFFDVLLADLQFDHDNEAMAVAYVRYDQARDRHRLGQLSDIDLLAAETAYQETRSRRFASQGRQQQTRARLALLLNRPDELPDELVRPRLRQNDRPLPELDDLLARARQHNPALQAARQQVAAARARLQAARAQRWPVIEAEGEVAAYSRVFGFSDPWRASIYVDVPFYQGGAVNARRDRERAALARLQAELRQQEHALAQAVREHWLQLERLRVEREQRRVQAEYRELYLDRARTLYDQEVETDLGDAMVTFTEAELLTARTEFELALTWASLEALLGTAREE